MQKKDNNLVLNSWTEEFGSFIADETSKLIKTCAKPKGEEMVEILTKIFMEHMIENIVYDSLIGPSNAGEENAYKLTKESFLRTKVDIQSSVAVGFERAFLKFAGREVDYYCQINAISEPINKELC